MLASLEALGRLGDLIARLGPKLRRLELVPGPSYEILGDPCGKEEGTAMTYHQG